MASKSSLLFAAALALIAVLYQVEVITTRWEAEDYALIPVQSEKLWKFVTNSDTIDKWFQWVKILKAVDSRPLGKGKRYEAIYNIPLIGEFALPLQITEFAPNRRVVMESDSLLKPRFVFSVEDGAQSYTKVSLKLRYNRNSALFRCTLGPLMWLLSSQQLRQSLFLLKMLFASSP